MQGEVSSRPRQIWNRPRVPLDLTHLRHIVEINPSREPIILKCDVSAAFAQQWMHDLISQPRAEVQRRPVRGNVFLDVTIEGQRYQGFVDDNHVFLAGYSDGRGCELGAASINSEGEEEGKYARWYLCKNENQQLLALPLSVDGLHALAIEFGLPIVPLIPWEHRLMLEEADYFYVSPAFSSLHAWATERPRRLASKFGDSYLGLWPMAALEGRRIEVNDANVARARARVKSVSASRCRC